METITTALETSFTTIATNMTGVITTALPIVLGVVGMGMVVTFGIKFFKKIAGRA